MYGAPLSSSRTMTIITKLNDILVTLKLILTNLMHTLSYY